MATQRATFEQRCKSLMKKASELAALPGTKACCVVVYDNEDGAAAATQPEVWPSAAEAARLFAKYKALPEGRFKKTTSQVQFLQNRVSKIREQVRKSAAVNGKFESLELLHECVAAGHHPGLVGVTAQELTDLMVLVEEKMGKVRARLQQLGAAGEGAHPPAAPMAPNPNGGELVGAGEGAHLPAAPMVPNPNGGELGAVLHSAFEGGDGAGPSGSGCDAMGAFNGGCDMEMESPWDME
jgi:hypothetical protein